MKWIVLIVTLVFTVFPSFSANKVNLGKIKPHNLMRIGGNNLADQARYDFVLLFKIRNTAKAFRAISDVQNRAGDNIHKIGVLENCVVASVKGDGDKGDMYSQYASATDYGELVNVITIKGWMYGDTVTDVMFGDVHISKICS